ncbi:hypothetical protein [Syntrophomonas wolfei]|uniref:hypothetical protein n=1 Tax=Syntrophomonas wolfei TaxID=863 RepID=UPI0013667801|nr:hypothetical protein [Syntrophomonas wolfei]
MKGRLRAEDGRWNGRQMSGERGCSSVAGHQLSENERMKAEGRGRWQKGGIFIQANEY